MNKFKESFYKASEKNMNLFKPSFLFRFKIIRQATINATWQIVENNICYDDLNIADFIREYFAGDLYRFLLHDRAPLVELITNTTLPEKRFICEVTTQGNRDPEYIDNGQCKFKDQYIESLESEQGQPKLFLRSKFLHNFATLIDLKASGKKYKDAKGFEKILAAQMLLGEADILQAENFGLIEKDGDKVFAKIDHGRSFYSCVEHWSQILMCDFNVMYGVKVDYKILSSELNNFVEFISKNDELINQLIDRKASNLNQILNPEMGFTLRYISSNVPVVFCKEVFSYSNQSKEFISDKGNNLNSYFKQRLKDQIKVMREYSKILYITAAISKNFQDLCTTLLIEFFLSQCTDPLLWAIETNKKLDGKNPLVWAIENKKQIAGEDAVKFAENRNITIDGMNPKTFAHIIQDKSLKKYLKAEHVLKKTAKVLFVGILAEVAMIATIHFRGAVIGITEQQQSLYLKIAVATTIITAGALLGVVAAIVGIKNHLDHDKNSTIENPNITCVEQTKLKAQV